MKTKDICHGKEARATVIEGIEHVFTAVASTLGPYGSTVVIENDVRKDNPPTVTKDGVSVASVINLSNPLQQLGAKLVLQASTQADTKSGDGTTTTVVLAAAMVHAAVEMVDKGMLPILVRDVILNDVKDTIEYLNRLSEDYPVTDSVIESVARISANGEQRLADVAIEALRAANGGQVTIRTHREEEDHIEVLHGAIIGGTPLTLDMLDRNSKITQYNYPLFAIYNGRFTGAVLREFIRVLDGLTPTEFEPMVVVAKDLEDGVEEAIAKNNLRNSRPIIVIPAPGAGQQRQRYLNAMCEMVGTRVIEPGQEVCYGVAEAVHMEANRTALIPNNLFSQGTLLDKLTAERNVNGAGTVKYKQFDEIIRFVLGRRVTVYVGGMTQADIKERYDRMVDATHAIEAVSDGVIPGGGTALAWYAFNRSNTPIGKAMSAPYLKILMNSGSKYDDALELMARGVELGSEAGKKYAMFYNVLNQNYADLTVSNSRVSPVYDPVRVTINALRAAAQVAITVITSNCYIIED